eukprot:CAMPEP_0206472908 /NCGR_PEP_ID=MMETSP0324_2-20121206/32518_1 /ASSEMBLY_ACC=CAM_ASM_000836 /TAXON_ID=2866 /ORGANISM="Crypthecodinium cohnii, Strain Seligo" /LENGTH=206 /DNA_ID=CAMNT_0053947673 /DNA_START=17 /DNA_END=637 /DNA_ORIENTATION=+
MTICDLVVVRDSKAEDVPAIQAIYAHHVKHGYAMDFEAPSVEVIAQRRQAILQDGLPFLVAVIDGEVVGYCNVHRFREQAAFLFTVEDSIYISHEHVGRGIGSRMLDVLLDRVKKTTSARQVVSCIAGANAPSVKLHLSRSFVDVGLLPSVLCKLGQWYDCHILQLTIEPEDGSDVDSCVSTNSKEGAGSENQTLLDPLSDSEAAL